jgi:hypothetical protein
MYRTFLLLLVASFFSVSSTFAGSTSVRSFETSQGVFKVFTSFGKYSSVEGEYSKGGMRHEMIELPNGRVYRVFPLSEVRGLDAIKDIVELEGVIYVLTRSMPFIYKDGSLIKNDVNGLGDGNHLTGRTIGFDLETPIYLIVDSGGWGRESFAGVMVFKNGNWKVIHYYDTLINSSLPTIPWISDWRPHYNNYVLRGVNDVDVYLDMKGETFHHFTPYSSVQGNYWQEVQ